MIEFLRYCYPDYDFIIEFILFCIVYCIIGFVSFHFLI